MSYDFDYYSGKYLKSPVKPKKPSLERNPTALDARAYADAMEEYERELEGYKEDFTFYQRSAGALLEELENRLKIEYGISDLQFNLIWSEAYDRKHSYGLEDVYHEFDSLFEFANTYKKLQ